MNNPHHETITSAEGLSRVAKAVGEVATIPVAAATPSIMRWAPN
jgi:hypothetical protein